MKVKLSECLINVRKKDGESEWRMDLILGVEIWEWVMRRRNRKEVRKIK